MLGQLGVALGVALSAVAGRAVPADNSPTRLIVDTDAGFDVDDIGALCVANVLQDNGEAVIVAVGHTNGFDKGIGAVSSIMHFYGRDDVPLGAYKGPWARNPNAGRGTADRYVSDLVTNYPGPVRNSSQVPSAVDVYRRVLASQPDGSVAIAAIGITTNMRDLVLSAPDVHSPLSGKDLIAQKVKLIVWMDMMYNFGCAEHDTYDWLGPDTGCRGSAQAAVMNWPSSVKQVFSRVGGDVLHGSWLSTATGRGNPCRQAFDDWLGPGKGRSSWDPITVLTAVRGAGGVHCREVNQGGHNTVDEAGKETWVNGAPGASNQSQNAYQGSPSVQSSISFELNELLIKPPGPWNASLWNKAAGENCYGPRGGGPAHGATDLERPATSSCGVMTLADCFQKCVDLPGCQAVTVSPAAGGNVSCSRKADVVLAGCDRGTSFDTHVMREWVLAGGFNCYGPRGSAPGHGAKDLEHPPGADCGTMTVRECQEKCAATPGCSAATWLGADHSGVGKCYRKADVKLASCDHGTEFDTYLAARAFH